MLQNINIPFKQVGTKTALGIIKKASGKTNREVKSFYQKLKTPEAKQITSKIGNVKLKKSQIKQLLQDTHEKGFYLNKRRLGVALSHAGKEEKHRLKEYGQSRSKMSERLENLRKVDRSSLYGAANTAKNSGNQIDDKKIDHEIPHKGKVIDLLID
ncbi:hypothetical protein HOD96_03155 [Candidatus Falkowbacteria bacterium]|jgi:hypothetical protein|nr:hypothetical protein [Candidatus Falkowbacteria bacterium]MBT4432745.1 hypothetical protein [Candidatus Falkowbacteria bacterium]